MGGSSDWIGARTNPGHHDLVSARLENARRPKTVVLCVSQMPWQQTRVFYDHHETKIVLQCPWVLAEATVMERQLCGRYAPVIDREWGGRMAAKAMF